MLFRPSDLDVWPMPLSYVNVLDLDILTLGTLDVHGKMYVCLLGQENETDRHRHTHDVKTITPDTSEKWGVKTNKRGQFFFFFGQSITSEDPYIKKSASFLTTPIFLF